MIGLIVCLIIGLVKYQKSKEENFNIAYLAATKFLFWWYTIIAIAMAVCGMLVAMGVGVFTGIDNGGIIGLAVGGILGTLISLVSIIISILLNGFAIVGAWLIHHALYDNKWSAGYLVIGGILIYLGCFSIGITF